MRLSILATHQMHVYNRFGHFLSRDLVTDFFNAVILSLPLIQVGQLSVTDDISVIFILTGIFFYGRGGRGGVF